MKGQCTSLKDVNTSLCDTNPNFGQLQSTLVNHMDIKRAVDLETVSVFQQLFELIFYPYNSLCFCLNQPIQAK